MPLQAREQLQMIAPQGWGFFTRSPREAYIQAYQGAETHDALIAMPPMRPENLFGLSRRGRGQPIEMAHLVNPLPPEAWKECGPSIQDCFVGGRGAPAVVRNHKKSPSLCGDIIFVQQAPVAWAYRDLIEGGTVAEKSVRLKVDCH